MKYLAAVFLLAGCSAHLAKTNPEQKDIKTIRYSTGIAASDGMYQSQFESGAEKACGGRDYDVLERTRKPSTLAGQELDSWDFYWVIRCK